MAAITLVTLALLAPGINSNAFSSQGGILLQISEIPGQYYDTTHNGWINVTSFTFVENNVKNPFKPTDTNFQLSFVHHVDSTTPLLGKAVSSQKIIPVATLQVCQPIGGGGQGCYMNYTLHNLNITSVNSLGGNFFTNTPDPLAAEESVTMQSCHVDLAYQPILPNGQKNGPPIITTNFCTVP